MEYLIGTLLAPNIASIVLNGVRDKVKEKQIEKELNEAIVSLNLSYENKEIDCGVFENFLYENVDNIKKYFLNIESSNYKIDSIFIDKLSISAVNFINNGKIKLNYPKIKNEPIVKQYFEELFSIINSIIENNLSLTARATINSINRNTDRNNNDIKNQNNHIIDKSNEMLEILKMLQNDCNQNKLNSLDEKLKNKLKINNINFCEESNIKIGPSNHEVKGIFLVKYNKFLSGFKNLSEVLNYSYMTQTPIILEPVEFKLLIDGYVIQEFKYENEDNSILIPLEFNSEGGVELATGYLENNKNNNEVLREIKIIPEKSSFDKYIRLENEKFETIIDNINIKVEDVINENNLITAVISNKHQEKSQAHITFKISTDEEYNIISNSVNFEIVDPSSALSIMYWINIMIKIKESLSLRARMIDGNDLFFEGSFNPDNNIDLNIEKELIQKLLYIENKLETKFNIPSEPILNYIDEINCLKDIVDTGISHINISSLSIKNEGYNLEESIPKEEKFLVQFISKDSFPIFNHNLDLGEHLIILTKVCINKDDKDELIVDVCSDSSNISICKKFYNGKFDAKSILEEYNLGKLGQ